MKVKRIGGIYDTPNKKNEAGSIYDPDGISPTLTTNGGGYHEPLIIVYEKELVDDKQIEKGSMQRTNRK